LQKTEFISPLGRSAKGWNRLGPLETTVSQAAYFTGRYSSAADIEALEMDSV
jgi:hypothetical protein